MSSGLGLDLGTGLAKVARCHVGEQSGPELAMSMIQTSIVYSGLRASIPSAGIHPVGEASDQDAVRCDGFPMMLDITPPRMVPAFQNRTPGEVTQDFLRRLLDAQDKIGGEAPRLTPIVVAVPPATRSAPATGESHGAGTALRDSLVALGRPSRRLVPSALAVLSYLRHSRPELASVTRFAVCDVGAGSASVSLCTADGRRTRLVDSGRVSATSVWAVDTQPTGSELRAPCLAEGLAVAALNSARAPLCADARAVRVWRAMETALNDAAEVELLEAVLEHAAQDPRLFGRSTALRVDGCDVLAADFLSACAPIAERCAGTLVSLISRRQDPAWLRFGAGDATRIVLTGGLSGLRPIRAALLAAVGVDPDQPGPGAVVLSQAERLGAGAYGAALVAAGIADPGDRYPHALSMTVHRQVLDRVVSRTLELAAAGSIDLDASQTSYLSDEDGPVLVTFKGPGQPDHARPIPVDIVRGGHGTPVAATFRPSQPPPPGTYQLGVRGGPDGAVVVLRNDNGEILSYVLPDPAEGGGGDHVR